MFSTRDYKYVGFSLPKQMIIISRSSVIGSFIYVLYFIFFAYTYNIAYLTICRSYTWLLLFIFVIYYYYLLFFVIIQIYVFSHYYD